LLPPPLSHQVNLPDETLPPLLISSTLSPLLFIAALEGTARIIQYFLRAAFAVKIAYLLLLCASVSGQVPVSETDLTATITHYRTATKFNMPAPVTDPQFRKSIHAQLPRFKTTSRLNAAVLQVMSPVLSRYDRAKVYDLIVVDSPVPMMMSDSGVVLVITTGMITEAESDDELLGYAAHEVAHEYFVQYSVYTKHLLTLVKEPALKTHTLQMLAVIELQCDAFAAITLDSLGYSPIEFIKGLERTPQSLGNHPPDSQRRKLVEGLSLRRVAPRRSPAFLLLKTLLSEH
jgi:hypothetical protein